jgi:hypothetical protein
MKKRHQRLGAAQSLGREEKSKKQPLKNLEMDENDNSSESESSGEGPDTVMHSEDRKKTKKRHQRLGAAHAAQSLGKEEKNKTQQHLKNLEMDENDNSSESGSNGEGPDAGMHSADGKKLKKRHQTNQRLGAAHSLGKEEKSKNQPLKNLKMDENGNSSESESNGEGPATVMHSADGKKMKKRHQRLGAAHAAQSLGKRGKNKKQPWTNEEANAVKRQLRHCIRMNRIPRKHEAEQALASEPALRKRTWKNIKDIVYNLVKKHGK